MKIENLLVGCLIFAFGFISCLFLFYMRNVELPFGFLSNDSTPSPGDWVSEKQIKIYDDKIVIELSNPSLSRYAPSGSMRPVLNSKANGIRIKPKSPEQINVGDIVSFRRGMDLVVHRVIKKGEDSEGVYFITKGDNNDFVDGKIRFKDIKYVTVGVIW